MFARLAALVLVAAVAGIGGCSYNPATFPYWLPPGRVEQTHAKPRGFGYFRDFDPKACRLEIKPSGNATAPLGSQIVLVATVYDKEGVPRRDRRVEWMIEGPGNIVEADESGFFAGRGYKVDNKYAVTYTSYVPKNITRGNDDPKDDVAVEPGQTFVVISSAIPGETVVTAYAPEVFNWDNGRVVTKVMWGDSRFKFPETATVRIGGETTLATSINPTSADAGGNFRVRYRVIGGPPAVLVSKTGDDTTASLSGSGGKEAEAFTDTNGEAAVRLVQRDPKAGKTRVAVEVVKPPENGVGPGTVVGRRETVVEWATAEVKLHVDAPPVASAMGAFPVTVALDNIAGVDSRDTRVRVTLSDGATFSRSEPPPVRQDEKGGLIFDLPPVNGKGKQSIVLQVKPAKVGQVTITADATTADGMTANTSAATRIEQGKLQLVLEVPPIALAGERIPGRIAVTNSGATTAENVSVWARFDEGLLAGTARSPVELSAGTLAPGQTKTLDLPLVAKTTGRYGIRANATGDGNLSASADALSVEVRKAELAVTVTGPKVAYLNQQVAWSLTVANRGDAPVSNAVVRATLPPEVKVSAADGGSIGANSVEWKLAELASGAQKSFKIEGDAIKLVSQAGVIVSVVADATNNGKSVGTPVEGRAETPLAVIGTPALSLELATPPGLTEVGKRIRFQIRVKNQGTVSARNIAVAALAPPELKPARGSGPSEGRIDSTGRVVFPTVEELQPGQTLTFNVDVDATQTGDARFTAEVKAAHLRNPLKEEQSIRVTAK
ncbi:Large cysteine-rich periplasmic protein OmcB precursor [Gemmata sp. SH-PL17]|uniref:DUF11 domain-containing protein n=1 Tax=Gemmata sp. SH-PL17 TaxID=1630693 RepID=UPI00078BCF60|nr:DUF11 domain-containing protein [Gemmata sp. SH-PL17]AMV23694.1 Large cysteine-rich periplasmic protein OmcB precursor [Gemmata sp. SH-PL17]